MNRLSGPESNTSSAAKKSNILLKSGHDLGSPDQHLTIRSDIWIFSLI